MTSNIVFIVGVPRSGTTLLRTMLGSHSSVLSLSETPWITGAYGGIHNLRELYLDLLLHPNGLSRNCSAVEKQDLSRGVREFLWGTFSRILKEKSAKYLLLKTPDDSLYSAFLADVFPESVFLHLRRDPRDVAISTLKTFETLNHYGRATPENCLQRWFDYEHNIVKHLASLPGYLSLEYASLTQHPIQEMEAVSKFLRLQFEKEMVSFPKTSQPLPDWEAGSRDVKRSKSIEYRSSFKSSDIPLQHRIAFNQSNSKIVESGYPSWIYHLADKTK